MLFASQASHARQYRRWRHPRHETRWVTIGGEDEYVLTEDAPLTAVLAAYHRLKDLPAGYWFQLDHIHACATLPAD